VKFALGWFCKHPTAPELTDGAFITDLATTAEAAGFSALYFTEHPIPGDDWLATGGHDALDPFVALGFAAASTTTLRLLTNLTVLPYRNPFLLAKTVATLDRLSRGRVILGVGTGYLETEYDALGVAFESRNRRFDESLEVLRKVWTGESVTHQGESFDAAGNTALPTPLQDPVPVWIGGNSKLSLRRVAERAQGWMPLPNPRAMAARRRSAPLETMEDLEALLGYLHAHADSVGRTAPLDILYVTLDGGIPGTPSFDPDAYRSSLAAQAELGVTWQAVNAAAPTPEGMLDFVRAFGAEVVAGR